MTVRGVVVTGAARGIGLAVARRFHRAGHRVSLWDQDLAALSRAAQTLGGEVHTAEVDVAGSESVTAAARSAIEHLGTVDVLVNNAGIMGPRGSALVLPLEDWARVLDVNLTGALHCLQEFVPPMRQRGWGRVVNIASIAGKEGRPDAPAYAASKAGLISLSRSLGQELARDGVLVNSVTPGPAETEIWNAPDDPEARRSFVADVTALAPIGRLLLPEEVAELVMWLASDSCSYSAGAVFDISGGRAHC